MYILKYKCMNTRNIYMFVMYKVIKHLDKFIALSNVIVKWQYNYRISYSGSTLTLKR